MPGQQENPSLIFPLTAMSSYQSVPKPWSSASSTGRTWAPIRAPISRSSATPTTSSDALAKSPSSTMSALPVVATVPTRLESSAHESSVGPRIVQQEEPYYHQDHKYNNNQLQTSLLGELDSILGRPIFNFFLVKRKHTRHSSKGQRKY